MIRLLAALALVGGTVYTGDGAPIPDATVLIEANRVQAVGAVITVITVSLFLSPRLTYRLSNLMERMTLSDHLVTQCRPTTDEDE